MWGSLSPARRRFVSGVVALLAATLAAALAIAWVSREPAVDPVAQDEAGPVLLVPGYGGSIVALQVLTDALAANGRDARIVRPTGSGTEDLRDQAAELRRVVDAVLLETGAPSVDLVGYSAGGVVVRIYVADLGGGSTVRRVVTLASPHHGTDLAALGTAVGSNACPVACQQLAPESDLLRRLETNDETPAGPMWVALWTEDDETVVPPDSGSLSGALSFAVQSVCPGLTVDHADVPRNPTVVAMVESVLETTPPVQPGPGTCAALSP